MIEVCYFTDEVSQDFEEAVKLGMEAGADSIEIRGNLFGKSVENVEEKEITKIKEILDKYSSRVAIIGSPVGKCSLKKPEEISKHIDIFKRMCSLAHKLNTDLIRTFPFFIPDKYKKTESRPNISNYIEEIVEGLKPMVEIAEQEDIKMCFETEPSTFSGDCSEVKQITEALGSSAARVTWDILGGWANSRETPYPGGYKLIEGKIEHLHIKANDNNNIKTVGDSDVTYKEILNHLINKGYDGAASIEHWKTPELMLSGIRQLRQLLNTIN